MTYVWGREYLDMFLNVCIPNQLAPGNVPALPRGSRYRILTRSIHVDELDAHSMVQALREVIPVDIVVVDTLDRSFDTVARYQPMIACHQQAIADILEADAAIIMLSADFVFSENALAAVVRRHREGYRAVVNTGLRLAKESFLDVLHRSGAPLDALASRDLVRMALPHLHPHTQSMFADARRFSDAPVAVYWRVAGDGLLARCMHLHPLMVDPMRPLSLLVGTNDGPYLAQACPDFSGVHVVTDSDELQMFELTTVEREVVPAGGSAGASVWSVAVRAAKCDELQLDYWRRRTIYLHVSDLDERWTAATITAEKFAHRALRRRPYVRLARRWSRQIGRIRKRRARYSKMWYRQRRRFRFERVRRWSERRRPRLRLKQIKRPAKLWFHRLERPVRVVTHRSTKTLRKTLLRATRRVFRQARAR